MLRLNKGTVEYLPVQVSDRLAGISSLDGYTIQFRVTDRDEVVVQDWTNCNNDGMTVMALIDTTGSDFDDGGTYKLYIKIAINPEVPVLGPIEFEVS